MPVVPVIGSGVEQGASHLPGAVQVGRGGDGDLGMLVFGIFEQQPPRSVDRRRNGRLLWVGIGWARVEHAPLLVETACVGAGGIHQASGALRLVPSGIPAVDAPLRDDHRWVFAAVEILQARTREYHRRLIHVEMQAVRRGAVPDLRHFQARLIVAPRHGPDEQFEAVSGPPDEGAQHVHIDQPIPTTERDGLDCLDSKSPHKVSSGLDPCSSAAARRV